MIGVGVRPGISRPRVWRTAWVAALSCLQANALSPAAVVRGAVAVGWLLQVGAPGPPRRCRPVFGLPRFGASLVHRNASLIAVVMIAIHVLTLLADPYAQLRLVDVVTSLLRHRIGQRSWRAIHWLAYAAWPVVTSVRVPFSTE